MNPDNPKHLSCFYCHKFKTCLHLSNNDKEVIKKSDALKEIWGIECKLYEGKRTFIFR